VDEDFGKSSPILAVLSKEKDGKRLQQKKKEKFHQDLLKGRQKLNSKRNLSTLA